MVCVVSGGNIGHQHLHQGADQRTHPTPTAWPRSLWRWRINPPSCPKSLAAVAATGANIIGVTFDRARTQGDVTSCAVELTMETKNFEAHQGSQNRPFFQGLSSLPSSSKLANRYIRNSPGIALAGGVLYAVDKIACPFAAV